MKNNTDKCDVVLSAGGLGSKLLLKAVCLAEN